MIPKASKEQKKIISLLKNNNVIVDSVAGSGKTTTNIYIAKTFKNLKIGFFLTDYTTTHRQSKLLSKIP